MFKSQYNKLAKGIKAMITENKNKNNRPNIVHVEETNFEELQNISNHIVAECQKIAAQYNISEEEAYEIYKKDSDNVLIVKSNLKNDNLNL